MITLTFLHDKNKSETNYVIITMFIILKKKTKYIFYLRLLIYLDTYSWKITIIKKIIIKN